MTTIVGHDLAMIIPVQIAKHQNWILQQQMGKSFSDAFFIDTLVVAIVAFGSLRLRMKKRFEFEQEVNHWYQIVRRQNA